MAAMHTAPVDTTESAATPLFIDVEEAAKLIGISRSSAYEAARTGELPTVRFGRRLRVPRGALLAMAGIENGGGEAA
jgi:excisionase family DNA binding protein